ncbi:M23 family metallopeptidase [Actinoplanes sp. NPDC026670]|uniref:M23 family metallopeptidase n=1 Tax=Actinoplanes sp. NPDC026670 TaxID=3154700 RepID=UPI0033EDD555
MTRASVWSRLRAVGVAAGILLGITVVPAQPASAQTGAMIQPVGGRVTGVLSSRCGSIDGDHYGVDIAGNNGMAIGAAYPGTVVFAGWSAGGGNMVTVNHASGYQTRYLHMVQQPAVTVGQQVGQGQVLGYVGSTGNSTGPHLHFEIRRNGAVYNISPAYACGGTVTKGAPINLPFADLPPANAIPDRVLVVRTNGTLAAKESLNGTVHELKTNVTKVSADRDRIAVIGTNGTAEVKVGGLTAAWVTLFHNAKDVVVDGDRYVVLGTDGRAWAKDGLYATNWAHISSNTTVIDAADGRIGVIESGVAKVKEGSINALWHTVAASATDLSLDGARIGVVEGGTAKVKEGPLNAGWVNQAAGREVVVEGYRVAVRDNSGNAYVKAGPLNAGWDLVATGATDLDVAGTRIAVVSGGWARVKEPHLNSSWWDIVVNARQVALANQ